ncbi:hypothetical protein [Hymenobacter negativus]|uniref:Uncharacterized protein n=1 Tax=Hymenobacter negativus TaxID=2795026 RepID=A0ABS3QM30_9BACT|nr:hypothetical protein [Hymenobacter negativus]MBO2011740.1 hypothetical protein [Hymenobacter negativus]
MVCLPVTGRQPLETLRLPTAYQEQFVSGAAQGRAYQCFLTLSDPTGWTIAPGGPAAAFVAPAAREHGVPGAAAVVAAAAPAAGRELGIGGAMGAGGDTPKRQYISANLKPQGMPLSLAEVEAKYGRRGLT